MENLIALVLGGVASQLQGSRAKVLPKWARYAVSFGSCIVIAFVASYVENMDTGGLHVDQVLKNIGTSFIASQSYYNLYMKPKNA